MTRGTARAGARSRQLQRIALRRSRQRPPRLRAPLGARQVGQRHRAAERFRSSGSTSSPTTPSAGLAEAGWGPRLERIVTVLTTLATLAVASFTWVSLTQVRDDQSITREGQITDRFNAAVENVGSDSLDVRLGGIYALQRITQDSDRDQPTVIDVLSAYVRTHAKKPKSSQAVPPSDVAAALNVLTFRDTSHDGSARVDLRGAYLHAATLFRTVLDEDDEAQLLLQGGNLEGAYLDGADLTSARLPGANLNRASLSRAKFGHTSMPAVRMRGASMKDTYLKGADLSSADLTNAYLRGADLTGADVHRANLTGADLSGAKVRGADLRGADLRGADLRGADLHDADLTDADLRGADFHDADLRVAKWWRAILDGGP